MKRKLIAAFLGVALIPLGLLGYLNHLTVRAALIEDANHALLAAASETAKSIDTFIQINLTTIQTEAQLPVFAEYLRLSPDQRSDSEIERRIKDILHAFVQKNPEHILSYSLVDSQGQVIQDTIEERIGLDVSRQASYLIPTRTGQGYTSPVIFSEASDTARLHFSQRIARLDDQPLGVLMVRYHADILQQLLEQKNDLVGTDSFGVLFDEHLIHLAHGIMPAVNFTVVGPMDDDADLASLQASDRLPSIAIAELEMDLPELRSNLQNTDREKTFRAVDVATGDRLNQVAVMTLDSHPWQMVFFQPLDVFLAPVYAQSRLTAVVAVAIAAVVTVVAVKMGQWLSQPILHLTSNVSRFAAGDHEVRASVKTNDEAQILAESFNSMAEEVSRLIGSLRESEARFRMVTEESLAGVFIVQKNKLRYVNPAMAEIFGYDPDDMIGLEMADIVHAQETEMIGALSPDHDINEKQTAHYSGQAARKDGSNIYAEVLCRPVTYQAEQAVIGTLLDITARTHMEQELRQALAKEKELSELKSRFASMVSHEFRTPLASIQLATGILKRYYDQMDAGKRDTMIDGVQTQIQHLTDLLDDVLTISRAEIVGIDFQPERVEIAEFCKQIMTEFQQGTGSFHRMVFQNHCPEIQALVDPKLLRRLLVNLLSNAIKYSAEGKMVQLDLECAGEQLTIRVCDEGIGIPEEDQQRLFTSFHRASNVGTIQGTGLGLTIVAQVAEAHGGTISVQSVIDVGTTFIIQLPTVMQPTT